MPARLSVNVNKVALLRNSRGHNLPDVLQVALDCVRFGAEGITVHPRPDQRHIRPEDVYALKTQLSVELNVEGYPSADFMELIREVRPAQCTLVPDSPAQLTSDHGWDCVKQGEFLTPILAQLSEWGVRSSLFVDAEPSLVAAACATGVNCVELYTGPYAEQYAQNPSAALQPLIAAGAVVQANGTLLNAGHDLNLNNLTDLARALPYLQEVSIGHALIADALYLGLEETIRQYRRCLQG